MTPPPSAPTSSGTLQAPQGHDISPTPADSFWGYLDQPVSEANVQEAGLQSAPVPNISDHISEGYDSYDNIYDSYENVYDSHGNVYHNYGNVYDYGDEEGHSGSHDTNDASGSGSDNASDPLVLDLRGQVPRFCLVGQCLYWHTSATQVKRHRDTHFVDRYGWLCPNQTDTCRNRGGDFNRRDGVKAHCAKFPACREAFRANGGRVECWGTPANYGDLVPYNPQVHLPYRTSDGRKQKL